METEINIKVVWDAIKKNLKWILLVTVIFAVLAAAYSFTRPPVYSSSAKFYSINYADGVDYSSPGLVSAQQMLVSDYIEIIKSSRMLQTVSDYIYEQYGKEYSVSQLNSMISASQTNGSSAFVVTVRSNDQYATKYIAKAITENMAPVIDSTVKRENSVVTLSPATEPARLSSNNVRNIFLGALIGFICSALLSSVILIYDKTIRTEDDLKEKFKYPIIGAIPKWAPADSDKTHS